METRFQQVTWLQASRRVRWRWNTEAVFHDLDGTFTQHSAGCKVLYDDVIADPRAFPECWQDARYGGTVCNSSLRFVTVGMTPPDPNLLLGPGFGSRLSYYGARSKVWHHLPPTSTTYHLPPTSYHLPPTTYCLSPTTYHLLPTTYHLLPVTYYQGYLRRPGRRHVPAQ